MTHPVDRPAPTGAHRAPARPDRPEAFAPGARPGELSRPDGTLAYDEQGEGPLAVLVPGLGDLRQEYRLLAPRLAAAGYRAVSVDLRGHGGSSPFWPSYGAAPFAEDLLALIDRLGGGPAVLVANSFAADPAVRAAADRSDAVAALVLVGPFVREHPVKPAMRLLMRALFNGPWRVRAWAWYYGTLFPTRKPADFAAYRRALRANLAEPGRFEAVKALMFRQEGSLEAQLARLQAPTLTIMGSKDPDFADPAAEAAWIAERTRGEALVIEGAGHYPFTEMPELAAEPILAFLRASVQRPDRREAHGA